MRPSHDSIELQPRGGSPNQKAINNRRVEQVATAFDFADLGAFFAMFLKESWHLILEEMAKYIIYPLAAFFALVRATLAWRQAKLDNNNSHLLVRAAVESAAGLMITAAIVGSLAYTAMFALISPIIFTAVMGAKALFNAGCALYYWGKSTATDDPIKKQHYRELAKGSAISAVAGSLATVAVGMIMIGHVVSYAVMGLVAVGIGLAYTAKQLFQTFSRHPKKGYSQLPTEDPDANKTNKDTHHHDNTLRDDHHPSTPTQVTANDDTLKPSSSSKPPARKVSVTQFGQFPQLKPAAGDASVVSSDAKQKLSGRPRSNTIG